MCWTSLCGVLGAVVGRDQPFRADVLLQVRAQHVEQRDEHGQLQNQRQAGRQRVDFVLLVELHQLLLLALFVVLVALFDLLHLGRQPLHLLHRLQLAVGQRNQHRPDQHRQEHDRQPPAAPHQVVVDEHHDPFEEADQGREGVLDYVREDHAPASPWAWAWRRACLEDALILDRVKAAVAERVAAQQPPGGEHQAAGHTELANRVHRVTRARRLVLAATRKRRARSRAGR